MDQDPPTVISYGYADGRPVSPNTVMNTAVGGVIGAFLAMAIIVITYLLNDTIMNAEDVERKLGLNLLGTLPYEEETVDTRTKKKSTKKGKLPANKVKNVKPAAKTSKTEKVEKTSKSEKSGKKES